MSHKIRIVIVSALISLSSASPLPPCQPLDTASSFANPEACITPSSSSPGRLIMSFWQSFLWNYPELLARAVYLVFLAYAVLFVFYFRELLGIEVDRPAEPKQQGEKREM